MQLDVEEERELGSSCAELMNEDESLAAIWTEKQIIFRK